MTPEELRADYAKALGHASKHVDKKGNSNAPEDVSKIAFNGVRSALFAKLIAASPVEGPLPGEDAEDTHHRQKKHNKQLWKQVEAAVAAAGLTESGAA